jgi:hypothetical protein
MPQILPHPENLAQNGVILVRQLWGRVDGVVMR